jgi:hypothetical protein
MPAKTRSPKAEQERAAQTGIKKMTRADFVEFITNLYTEDASKLEITNMSIDRAMDFLRKYQPSPPNMKEILENGPIVSHTGLICLASNIVEQEQKENEQSLTLLKDKKEAKLTTLFKQKQRDACEKDYAQEYKKAEYEYQNSTMLTVILCFMHHFQQLLTKFELSVEPSAMVRKVAFDEGALFHFSSDFVQAIEEESKKQTSGKSKTCKGIFAQKMQNLVKSLDETDFEKKFNALGEQMIQKQKLGLINPTRAFTEIKKNGDLACLVHEAPVVTREKFIQTFQSLKIWAEKLEPSLINQELLQPIQPSFDDATTISCELFKGNQLQRVEQGIQKSTTHMKQIHGTNTDKLLQDGLAWNTKAEMSQIFKIKEESPLANLHLDFANFAAKILCHLATVQEFASILRSRKSEYEFCVAQEVEEGLMVDCTSAYYSAQELQEKTYKEQKENLKSAWGEITNLAQAIPYTETNANLFNRLTHEVITDFGLHELTVHIFGDIDKGIPALLMNSGRLDLATAIFGDHWKMLSKAAKGQDEDEIRAIFGEHLDALMIIVSDITRQEAIEVEVEVDNPY